MRYLVLSDIHANIDALDAVLDHPEATGCDRVVVLGDLVGYGAEPNAVVARIQALAPVAIVRGNHDKVASGQADSQGFNPTAERAVNWTRRALTPDVRDYLAALPKGPVFVDSRLEVCHGTPLDEDAYVFGEIDAVEALLAVEAAICLFGHTHVPMAATLDEGRELEVLFHGGGNDHRAVFDDARRYLVNPGSVGQPRDGDPRAACGLLDVDRREFRVLRVEYPVERARERILEAGLPTALGNRLLLGR
jgi:predicted phosphodiesterase